MHRELLATETHAVDAVLVDEVGSASDKVVQGPHGAPIRVPVYRVCAFSLGPTSKLRRPPPGHMEAMSSSNAPVLEVRRDCGLHARVNGSVAFHGKVLRAEIRARRVRATFVRSHLHFDDEAACYRCRRRCQHI